MWYGHNYIGGLLMIIFLSISILAAPYNILLHWFKCEIPTVDIKVYIL